MLNRRDIFLRIEQLNGYSPVVPAEEEHARYGHDCFRGHGHEDAMVPQTEIDQRRLDALVYREYLDEAYTIPKLDKIIPADLNEPPADRRIPGTVIYTEPGERLFIHVFNADDEPHSFHLHGLAYGIDSDGAWPFGVASTDGRRSDEICPNESWTYVFDATEESIGAWPFHDHCHDVIVNVNRGLFGGIVVRDPKACPFDLEVPIFLHRLEGERTTTLFDSGTLTVNAEYSFTFPRAGDFSFFCRFHAMQGQVHVVSGGPMTASIDALDSPSRFDPLEVTVGIGGTVTWRNRGTREHTATEAGGGALNSFALNGRTFVGNTPTIAAITGQRIRWYVFNLDFGEIWHNFHMHGMRWRWGHEIVDTRGLSPAESFVADTIAPPVILPPAPECESERSASLEKASPGWSLRQSLSVPSHHSASAAASRHKDKPHSGERHKVTVCVQGDFLVHCHLEQHMMEGMAALVRVTQELSLTPKQREDLETALGYALPEVIGTACREVDAHRCMGDGTGHWDPLPDSPIFVVHAALLHTGKVLLFSGTAEIGGAQYPLESRLWDPAAGMSGPQSFGVDLFCSGHAFLPDGRLCVAGGASTPGTGIRATNFFEPASETWSAGPDMAAQRWYPTVLTLPDGRILAVSGRGGVSVEVFDGIAWSMVTGADRNFPELYPSLHLLPSGEIFYTRCGWNAPDAGLTQTGYLRLTGATMGGWSDLGLQTFSDRQEGCSVIQIDDTVDPPATKIFVFGGGASGAANAQSAESIDVTGLAPAPVWQRLADLSARRMNVNGVLLPDGTILVLGGHRNPGRFGANDPVLEPEIYDPVANTFTPQPPMLFPRGYHSVAILIPDGRVVTAGGPGGAGGFDNQFNMEIFSPPYLFRGPRPVVTAAPATAQHGDTIMIDSPDAAEIDTVVLLRPQSMTHHTDAGARYIRLQITGRLPNQLQVRLPTRATVAPPGYYLLFAITRANRVPSEGRFIRIDT